MTKKLLIQSKKVSSENPLYGATSAEEVFTLPRDLNEGISFNVVYEEVPNFSLSTFNSLNALAEAIVNSKSTGLNAHVENDILYIIINITEDGFYPPNVERFFNSYISIIGEGDRRFLPGDEVALDFAELPLKVGQPGLIEALGLHYVDAE